MRNWILLLALVISFGANPNGLSDEDLLAERPQEKAEENNGDSDELKSDVGEQSNDIVFVPISQKTLNTILTGQGDKDSPTMPRITNLPRKIPKSINVG